MYRAPHMVADPGSWVPGAGYERNHYSLYTTKKMQVRKQACGMSRWADAVS
jgi:hypothetical protein